MKKTSAVIPAVTALAIAAVLALTGCVPSNTGTPAQSDQPTRSAAATAKPSESAAPSADTTAVKVGQALTPDQVAAIQKNWEGSTHAYKMSSGTYVATDENQPLPPAVKSDIAASATAVGTASTNNSAFDSVAEKASYATGRGVVVVAQRTTYAAGSNALEQVWVGIVNARTGSGPVSSKAAAIAWAKSYIAQQQDPSSWDIAVQ